MEAKEILSRVKNLFTELMAPPVPENPAPEVKEYEIKGGGKVTIDKLEAGGIVMIDGAPALPGDLELVDGTKIKIVDNGVIEVIELGTPEAEVETPEVPEDMGAKFSAFETSTNEKFTAYEAKLSAYEQRFAANETQLSAYKVELGKHKEMIEKLLQFGQLMVDAPISQPDPATKINNNFKEEDMKIKASSILFN